MQIVFRTSGQLFLLCPFGPIAPLHFEHLCSGQSKLLAFRWFKLPHALHRGLGQSASLWPCSWQRSHTSSLGRSFCSCDSSPHELRMLTILVGHSRAEWPAAPHVLHTRYGHVPLLLAMPRLRAHRTIIWARCAAGTVRLRSTVTANHRALMR